MASSMGSKLVFVVLLCMVVSTPLAQGAISCGAVVSKLQPCTPYLTNKGPLVPGCCNGIKALNAAAKTTPDRQAACNCIKNTSLKLPGLNLVNAQSLPGKCGVSIPYKISPNIDCSKVQ